MLFITRVSLGNVFSKSSHVVVEKTNDWYYRNGEKDYELENELL